MEQAIKDRYNNQILQEALKRYRIVSGEIRMLDGFESFIYEFRRNSRDYILRLSHSLRRDENLIQGEIDWINFLAAGGATVAKAFPSEEGLLVERINDGINGYFLATVFEKATGKPPGPSTWNEALVSKYGQLIGLMHALSKDYAPQNAVWKRPDWDDPEMLAIETWLPKSEPEVLLKFRELKINLDMLPRDKSSYGLIHQDAHAGNFFVDEEGRITLFDFDDCAYSWYINDIAIALFYVLVGHDGVPAFAETFMKTFLQGYVSENRLDPAWLSQIPHFLKLREIELYAVIHRSFNVDDLTDPWVASYMKDRKVKIENNEPFVKFDFSTLSPILSK